MEKKRKVVLLVVVALLVFTGILRELGYINLSYYTFKYQNNSSPQSQAFHYSEAVTISSRGVFVASALESSFADAVKGELERQLNAKSSPYISVSLNRLEIEGAYWLPLFKKGHCVYEMQAKTTSGNTSTDILISGEMDFSLEGICSTLTLKQVLAKTIVQKAVKQIEG